MSTITVPASKVRQGKMVLYTASIKVRDLKMKDSVSGRGFCSVETLDPKKPNDKGYQRLLQGARAKKLSKYIIKGQEKGDVLLPTSIFLATDKTVPFDENTGTITIDMATVCPFNVVDGQHRLEGLKIAAMEDERVLDFEVPVNIATGMNMLDQMCHFYLVNTTQRSVDESIGQRIIARLTEIRQTENILTLPSWMEDKVKTGDDQKALDLLEYLNETPDSPWLGRIRMANDADAKDASINQKTFTKAVIKDVLSANNLLSRLEISQAQKVFLNYWKAIANHFDDEDATVLYKYNGVLLFCRFSTPFFREVKAQKGSHYTVEVMQEVLQACFDNMEGDHATVSNPSYWYRGGPAGGHNQSAMNGVFKAMVASLHDEGDIKT